MYPQTTKDSSAFLHKYPTVLNKNRARVSAFTDFNLLLPFTVCGLFTFFLYHKAIGCQSLLSQEPLAGVGAQMLYGLWSESASCSAAWTKVIHLLLCMLCVVVYTEVAEHSISNMPVSIHQSHINCLLRHVHSQWTPPHCTVCLCKSVFVHIQVSTTKCVKLRHEKRR